MDEDIRKKIQSLDNEFPKVDWNAEDVWTSIGKKRRTVQIVRWGLAASVLIAAVIFFIPSGKEKITITYREEKLIPNDTVETGSWSLIEESCRAKVVVCGSKEFIELKTQWEDLQKESEMLDNEEKTFGQNPAISKAKEKVESVKQDIEKEILSMINS